MASTWKPERYCYCYFTPATCTLGQLKAAADLLLRDKRLLRFGGQTRKGNTLPQASPQFMDRSIVRHLLISALLGIEAAWS
jgi:hypothetical protein